MLDGIARGRFDRLLVGQGPSGPWQWSATLPSSELVAEGQFSWPEMHPR